MGTIKCQYLPAIPVTANAADQSRDEWLEQRRQGIGGSDAAAILGLSPWSSAYNLWQDKTNQAPDVIETDAMRRGTETEPKIREAFAAITNRVVVDTGRSYHHPEIPWMLANLDGLVLDDFTGEPVAILEIKNSHNRFAWNDGVPAYYVAQVQHYMAVVNIDLAYVCVLIDDVEFRIFEIPADAEYQANLIEAEGRFWDLIQTGQRPEVDGSESTHEMLRKTWSAIEGASVELAPEVVTILKRRAEVVAEIKAAEDEKRTLESTIMTLLQDAEAGTIDGQSVVTWKEQTARRLDSKALAAAHPDLVEEFKTESTTRVLRFKAVGA